MRWVVAGKRLRIVDAAYRSYVIAEPSQSGIAERLPSLLAESAQPLSDLWVLVSHIS